VSKLKPETLNAVAAVYARILERNHPGSTWTVRPIKATERQSTTTLWNRRGQVATLNHDCSVVNGEPSALNEHGIEGSAQKVALVTDVKVSPSDSSAIERHAA